MSYINEALKKAQQEKDGDYQQYSGIITAGVEKKSILSGKKIWQISFVFCLVSFVFISYSWFDSRNFQSAVEPDTGKNVASSDITYQKALKFQKSKRLNDAELLYLETLKVNPAHIDALNNLGVIYLYKKDFSSALKKFKKVVLLKPNNIEGNYNLACLYAIKGESAGSLTFLEKAIAIDVSVKDWARQDTDFNNLRDVPGFNNLMKIKNYEP